MNDSLLAAYVAVKAFKIATIHRLAKDERGEGVISAAIAVLIMAFLGAAMWLGFKSIWGSAEKSTSTQVGSIGS